MAKDNDGDILGSSRIIKVIKKAMQSPNCDTELHIEIGIASLEPKY